MTDKWPDDMDAMRIVRNRGLRAKAPGANQVFADFNGRYFGGRLPTIKVKYSASIGRQRIRHGVFEFKHSPAGMFHAGTRFSMPYITLNVCPGDGTDAALFGVLLHEMVHAAGFGRHDEAFAAEIHRLKDLGAPVNDFDLAPQETGLTPPVM
jgi:hypothetical protein